MREIKFKAWIMPYEMMVEVQRINFDVQTVEVQIGEGDLYEFNFEEIELMRSTGLKDKNGVEIYEGDIVENYKKEIVEYENGGFKPFTTNTLGREYGYIPQDTTNWNEVKVIGNIHESPELLEELDE